MPTITLGSRSVGNDFSVSDLTFSQIIGTGRYYLFGSTTLSLADSRSEYSSGSDYVTLTGHFRISTTYSQVVKDLSAVKRVDGGQLSYTITGLDVVGADVASSAAFKDYLAGKAYAIVGNERANHLSTYDLNDILKGNGGNDILEGMGGRDRLYGGYGNDRLEGGSGNDLLSGSLGADVFVFKTGSGTDVVTDFRAFGVGQDKIDLSGHADVTSFADLSIHSVVGGVEIDFGTDSIILKNVSILKVDASDFIF